MKTIAENPLLPEMQKLNNADETESVSIECMHFQGGRLGIHSRITEKFAVYTFSIYLCSAFKGMKILSLKLDEEIFNETEEITAKLKLARNRYINEALNLYNQYNRRRLLKQQLIKESALSSLDSLDILREFEQLTDEDQAV